MNNKWLVWFDGGHDFPMIVKADSMEGALDCAAVRYGYVDYDNMTELRLLDEFELNIVPISDEAAKEYEDES